jgi:hypothetical protein
MNCIISARRLLRLGRNWLFLRRERLHLSVKPGRSSEPLRPTDPKRPLPVDAMRVRDLRRVHRVRLVAALDLACIERDRGPDVTGHDDQHLMWGALIRRSVVCCTPAPAPAPLSLRDDRVEGATTELTAVGGPRVRISLPPAVSSVVEPRAPGRRSPWGV